jgi:acetylornithine/succinyldiaminopimelate/putrescine aminotransferase
LQERGVLALMAGNLVIRLLPPLVYGQEQVDELLNALEDVLNA